MTGFEYAFGGLLLARGMVEEGENVVRAVRQRHDGERRNPWNEFECGSNYARSMASFALIPIFAGFTFDLTRGEIGFFPVEEGDHQTFWSLGSGWGSFMLLASGATLTVCEGLLELQRFSIPNARRAKRLLIDGEEIAFTRNGDALCFSSTCVHQSLAVLFES